MEMVEDPQDQNPSLHDQPLRSITSPIAVCVFCISQDRHKIFSDFWTMKVLRV